MIVGKGWVQGVALVMLFGFFVMGILAYRTYSDGMPQPERVVTEDGQVLFILYDKVRELYFQDPDFGFYFLKLTSERLLMSSSQPLNL